MPREKTPATPNPNPTKRAPRKSSKAVKPSEPADIVAVTRFVDPEQRAALIAEAAYFRAEKRGFAPGTEVEDWLAAEAEVDAILLRGSGTSPRV